ncbi:MAG: thiol-disulfide isomerase/thioredoxin [Cognaticolwellia sp.]|jgi:thiol-disulfide isomerase/thioredoxin
MFLILLACLTPRQADQLVAQNAELANALGKSQGELARAASQLAECQTSAAQPTAAQEIEAAAMLVQANEALERGDALTAKGMVAVILSEYGSTQAARGAMRVARELEAVGLDAVSLDPVEWWQGQYEPNAKATLIVFWEQWCSHCRREMPKTNLQWQRYKDQGLQVIGLTKVTKSSTDESARALLIDQDIGFAVGKENGSVSEAYFVSGIPAAVVIQDGKVIWRGHPAKISDEAIESWLE